MLIGGPVAAALGLTGAATTTVSGAVTGALAGGLIGGLVALGIPEATAQEYESTVRAGGVVLAVPTKTESDTYPQEVFQQTNANQITKLNLPNI